MFLAIDFQFKLNLLGFYEGVKNSQVEYLETKTVVVNFNQFSFRVSIIGRSVKKATKVMGIFKKYRGIQVS